MSKKYRIEFELEDTYEDEEDDNKPVTIKDVEAMLKSSLAIPYTHIENFKIEEIKST